MKAEKASVPYVAHVVNIICLPYPITIYTTIAASEGRHN
jgi:hypothetical protein